MDFNKPPQNKDQQVSILQGRGLIIPDHDFAANKLQFINYYRFSGYCLYFEELSEVLGERSHRFKPLEIFVLITSAYGIDNLLLDLRQLLIMLAEYTLQSGTLLRQ